jgi:hypothetical protein
MGVVFCLRVADVSATHAPGPHDRCEICGQQVWGDHGDAWWADEARRLHALH